MRRLTLSTDAAEELTVEICRRLRSGQPHWLANKAIDSQLRFFVAQVILEHRGVLPASGRRPSAGRQPDRSAASPARQAHHIPYPMAVREGTAGGRRPAGHDGRADAVVGPAVAQILASLAAGGPASSWPGQLVADCQVTVRMSGVGLAVTSQNGPAALLAATAGPAQKMEDLQFALGEGPCVDAGQSGRPVLNSDLADASARWPAFAPAATGAGVHAAFTFPLQVGAIGIGVLDLYRTTPGGLDSPQLGQALAFADAAVAVLLHMQDRASPDAGFGTSGDGVAAPAEEVGVEVLRAVDRSAVVHQATGMISVQLDVSLAVAMSRLRAHTYAADRPILNVAADVVARRLAFDDSDAGTASALEHRRWRTTGEEESS